MNDLHQEMEFLRARLVRPYQKNPAPKWDEPQSVYKCLRPLQIFVEGEPILAPCRKCKNCHKSRMQEWSARGIAEGLVSDDIAFITHTYDPKKYPREAQEFHKENTQRFCQNLRNYIRPWGGKVRYLITGERGANGQQQVHWHGVYFFQGRSGLENSPAEGPNRGRSWPENRRGKKLWPWGHLNIEKIDPRNANHVAKRVRYVVKYMFKDTVNHKGFRGGDVARMRASKGRRIGPDGKPESEPLGTRFFEEEARRTARNMVHLTQDVVFPGIVNKKGRMQKHCVFGIIRDYVIRAYKEEVGMLLPEGSEKYDDLLTGPFLAKYDPETPARYLKSIREEIARTGKYRPKKPIWYHRRQYTQAMGILPTQKPERDMSGAFPADLRVRGRAWSVGTIRVNRRGIAVLHFFAPFRGWKIGERYKIVSGSLRELFPIGAFDHDAFEAWLKERRGPDWISPEAYREKRAEKLQRLKSALLAFSDRRGVVGNTTALRRQILYAEQQRAMSRGEAWWMWAGRFRPGHFGDDGTDESRNVRVWRDMFDPYGRFVMQDEFSVSMPVAAEKPLQPAAHAPKSVVVGSWRFKPKPTPLLQKSNAAGILVPVVRVLPKRRNLILRPLTEDQIARWGRVSISGGAVVADPEYHREMRGETDEPEYAALLKRHDKMFPPEVLAPMVAQLSPPDLEQRVAARIAEDRKKRRR